MKNNTKSLLCFAGVISIIAPILIFEPGSLLLLLPAFFASILGLLAGLHWMFKPETVSGEK